jgi:hypothetical protein
MPEYAGAPVSSPTNGYAIASLVLAAVSSTP